MARRGRERIGGLLAGRPLPLVWGACIMVPMNTSTDTPRQSIWSKPLGQVLAERKGRAYFKPAGFGTAKTGLVELKSDGRMIYTTIDGTRAHKEKFDAADVVSARVETAADYVERIGVGRVAGGALVGGVLLGPLGLALGAGAGALAKQKHGGAEYLVIELPEDRTVTVEVAKKHAVKAREMRDIITPTA